MSSRGRCQDALADLFEYDTGYDGAVAGPVKSVGVTWAQWNSIIEDIIDAIYPIAYQQGRAAIAYEQGRADT